MQAFSYYSPNGFWRHLKFTTSLSDWFPRAPLEDVSNSFDRFSWGWAILFREHKHPSSEILHAISVGYVGLVATLKVLPEIYVEFMFTSCFYQIPHTKRFFLSSKRYFKLIRAKSVEMTFCVKRWNLDCDVTLVWLNHSSNTIGDFTFQRYQLYRATFPDYWEMRSSKATYWDKTPCI